MEAQPETPVPNAPAKPNKTIWIAAGCAVLACCCLVVLAAIAAVPLLTTLTGSRTVGAGYSGNASELLRKDTLKAIKVYEDAKYNCTDISLLSGQIVSPPDKDTGVWTESWQVQGCGAVHLYTTTFTPTPDGGADYAVHPEGQ